MRSTWAGAPRALVAAIVLASACTGSDDNQAAPERAPVPPLPGSQMIAVCLTDPPASSPDRPIRTDLCTVDVDGTREIVVAGVDDGEAVALSPDRRRAAFVGDGTLQLINVDGTDEVSTGVAGSAPAWLESGAIGLVTPDGREIVVVDADTHGTRPLFEAAALPPDLVQPRIESFAITEDGERLVASVRGDGDEYALVDVDLPTGEVQLLLGPMAAPITDPDWGPDDQLVVALDYDLYLVDPTTSETTLISAEQHVATTPTWSADGRRLAWVANAVGAPEGPAILLYAETDVLPPIGVTFIVGNRDQPLDQFPAFPDW